ncbi:MAG: hypothetical protein AB7J32_14580 [Pseudonocardia sp.]
MTVVTVVGFAAAGIDHLAGRWDDAVAELDGGIEAAAVTGTGWLSRPIGLLVTIRSKRGELDAAAAEIERWKVRGLPEQFGLPFVELGEILVGEARGDAADVVAAVRQAWTAPITGGRAVWAPLAGPEIARIALRVELATTVARVRA